MWKLVCYIAIRQLWAKKLLNGIAVAGVTLGVLTLIVMNAIIGGFQVKFLSNMLRITPHIVLSDKQLRDEPPILAGLMTESSVVEVKHETPSDRQLRIQRPNDVIEAIEAMPGVVAATASMTGFGILNVLDKQRPIAFHGIYASRQDAVTPLEAYMTAGSFRDLDTAPNGVLVGVDTAEALGLKVGDNVTCSSNDGRSIGLRVIGVFSSGIEAVDKSRIYVGMKNGQALLGKQNIVSRIEIRLEDANRAPAVAARIEQKFGYDAESWQEASASSLSLFAMQDAIKNFMVTAILAVGGFGILAIQIMIVLQKTRDIALLRSVGFRRSDVLSIFFLQGVIVALLGAALGDGLGHMLVSFLGGLKIKSDALVKSETFLVHDDPWFYVYGVVFAVVTGTLASFLPAYRGSRIEPVDVLRGQIG